MTTRPVPAPAEKATVDAVAEPADPVAEPAAAPSAGPVPPAAREARLVLWRTMDSPVGPLLLAATPRGLVRVAFAREDFDAVRADLARRLAADVRAEVQTDLRAEAASASDQQAAAPASDQGSDAAEAAETAEASAALGAAAVQLGEYFHGRRRDFELPLDHALSQGFRAQVQALLPEIPYGQTSTYQELARAAGQPRAARAVGAACATNPLPVVVPCHRVLRSDGAPGGYLGGLAAKQALLDLERAA